MTDAFQDPNPAFRDFFRFYKVGLECLFSPVEDPAIRQLRNVVNRHLAAPNVLIRLLIPLET